MVVGLCVAMTMLLALTLELALHLVVLALAPMVEALLDEFLDVAAGLAHSADRGLAELALAVRGLLLAPRLRLARPRRCDPPHQHILVARREVHEPDRSPSATGTTTATAAAAAAAPTVMTVVMVVVVSREARGPRRRRRGGRRPRLVPAGEPRNGRRAPGERSPLAHGYRARALVRLTGRG